MDNCKFAGKLTTAQAAKLMNVSERAVYMCKELIAAGRDDLLAEIDAGRMTVSAALKIAKPEKYARQQSKLEQLKRQWFAATLDEQVAFMDWILVTGGYVVTASIGRPNVT